MALLAGYSNRKHKISYPSLILVLITILSGCGGGIRTIKPEYMSDFHATRLFDGGEHLITLNAFYDERTTSEKIGEGYTAHGGRVETWVTDNDPLLVVEKAFVGQLINSGFTVVRTKGWNFDPNSIPEEVKTRLIIGGKLKTFWVESRPNFWVVTINSKVSFDLFLTDTKYKKNLYAGQFTGNSQSDHGLRGDEDMQNSVSFALTQAINKAFQDDTVREILLKKWR